MDTPIITLKGKELISIALGSNNKLMLTKIGFGDKATNPTKVFTENSTALVNERFRINLDEVFYPGFDGDNNAILRIVANVTNEQMSSIDSMTIKEFAIYDNNNNIFMIGNTVATLNKENGNSVGISFEVNVALPTSEKLVNIVYSSKAGEFTEAYKIKLNSIDEGATKNKTDNFLLDRSNHTGKQGIDTITNLESILITINNKITAINSPFKGVYASLDSFKVQNTKYPVGEEPEDGNITDSLPDDNFYNMETGSLFYFTTDKIWMDGNNKLQDRFVEVDGAITTINYNLEVVNEVIANGKYMGAYDNLIDIPKSIPVLDEEGNPVIDDDSGLPLTDDVLVNSYAVVKNSKSVAYFNGVDWVLLNSITGPIIGTKEKKVSLGASNNIDLAEGNLFIKNVTSNITFTLSNISAGNDIVHTFILEIVNGGNYTITWFNNIKWDNGTAPTLSTAGTDILSFYTHDKGVTWRGFILAIDSK